PIYDLDTVAFRSFEEEELMNTHLTSNTCEECQGQLDDGMKSNKTSDTRIHFFNRYRCVPTTKCVYPSSNFYTVGHDLRSFPDILHLSFFNAGHDVASITEPLFCKHN